MSARLQLNYKPPFVEVRVATARVVMVPAVVVAVDVCSLNHQLYNVPIAHYALNVAAAYRA
jgi:hypothetical protein